MTLFSLWGKKKSPSSPNILLTNFCNQNCSYCFAKEEMKRAKVQEMLLVDFKKLVKMLEADKVETLRLMGGEPTLHSEFKEVIRIGMKKFKKILIFSNGLIPNKNKKILEKNIKKITFNFNLDTHAFKKELKRRKEIIKLIEGFSKKTKLNVGFTLSDLKCNYRDFLKDFDKGTLSRMGIRFGFAKAIIGQKPFFSKKDYRKLGNKIVNLMKFFKTLKIKDVFVDCGLQKDMFTASDRAYLFKNIHFQGWGCEGKWSSFDVAPDLTIFPCFPYYKKSRRNLRDFVNLNEAEKFLKHKKTCVW